MMSPTTQRILRLAEIESQADGGGAVEPKHILIAMILEGRNYGSAILNRAKVEDQSITAEWLRDLKAA